MMVHYLASNLKLLRDRNKRSQSDVAAALDMKRSQSDVAAALDMKRSTYSGWETGVSEPNLESLVKLRMYHKLPLDMLLMLDMRCARWSDIEVEQRRPLFPA